MLSPLTEEGRDLPGSKWLVVFAVGLIRQSLIPQVEPWDKKYQYLLFAADPYEVISFKIPNHEIDNRPDHFFTHWDSDQKTYTLQLYFKRPGMQGGGPPPPPPPVRRSGGLVLVLSL